MKLWMKINELLLNERTQALFRGSIYDASSLPRRIVSQQHWREYDGSPIRLSSIIMDYITWCDTTEGTDYWLELHCLLEERSL